jgi:MFS family permease
MGETDRLGGANIWTVIGASGVGTMIEWYDFYIFGSLALVLASQFFPSGNQTLAVLSTLATFAAGFAARPFGALFFGRIGDLVGRKYAFLVTLVIMGGRHVHHRTAADVRPDRGAGADHPGLASPLAGIGPRR